MRIVVTKTNVLAVVQFKDLAVSLRNRRFYDEMFRGVIDAGRKSKTRVQKAVHRQMALKPGTYQSHVVQHTRGVPRKGQLAYEIFSVRKGQPIQDYKGLQAVKLGGASYRRMNASRDISSKGTVRSGVWNRPRIFKRSFQSDKNSQFYAMRPSSAGASSVAPRLLWTYGSKGQSRDGRGRFMSNGKKYGKLRKLFGPALRLEIPEGDSLKTFMSYAPGELQKQVEKRLAKLVRY